MPKYQVSLAATAGATITVEADDEEAAIEKAFGYTPGVCAQCSGWGRAGITLDIGDYRTPRDREGRDLPISEFVFAAEDDDAVAG